jgi:2-iminobutanoate/2-iminopropanoate deaminase
LNQLQNSVSVSNRFIIFAIKTKKRMKRIISTPNAPAAIGPYSQAVEANGTLYISGQLPINPAVGKIEATNVTSQTEQVFKNIEAILAEAGYTFLDVVKSTVFLSDIANFGGMNEVYKKYYATECPARSAFAVKDLPMGALVEIETVAVTPNP